MNPIAVGAVGLCLIGIWCVGAGVPAMENDIEGRVQSALLASGVSAGSVEVRGRKVTLAGMPNDQAALALSTAEEVWGARSVALKPRGPSGTTYITVEGADGVVTITGQLGTPELQRLILRQAVSGFQGRDVKSNIVVAGGGAPPISWPSTFAPLFTVAGRAIGDLVLTLDETALSIDGEVGTPRAVDSLGAQFMGAAPGVDLYNGLRASEDINARIAAAVSGRRIEFETGSSRISRAGRGVLDAVARALLSAPTYPVRIEGHTDSEGDAGSNRLLSQSRAESVLRYLTSRGVDPTRLSAHGLGADRSTGDNGTEAERSQSRRIEFKVEGN